MKKFIALVLLSFFYSGCAVSDKVIDNYGLYCSDVYRGIRATARYASAIAIGASTPDLCETVQTVGGEERGTADANPKRADGSTDQ